MPDWTQPPMSAAPGDLESVLSGARLAAVENDRPARRLRLRFILPSEAGPKEATFVVEAATHLLGFVYLPPAFGPPEGDPLATVGAWARQGLVLTADPLGFGTPLVVQRARLHGSESAATLMVEGYGDDPDTLVWWEVRASGASIEAL